MLEECRGLRSYCPVVRIWQFSPLVNLIAQLVDDRRRVVLLLFGGKPFALVEYEHILLLSLLAGLRDRCDELGFAAGVYDSLGWLPLRVEFPMSVRRIVRGVENRMLKMSSPVENGADFAGLGRSQ
jgi:hypothetical protein